MNAFSTLLLERGAASLADLEASVESQVLYGGDLGTNLVELGLLKENTLQRLLSEYHEMPIGPHGPLSPVSRELEKLVSKDWARRLRVYPVKRTQRALHLAASEPLDPDTERELREAVGMQLRLVAVTPFRLREALWRYCGIPLGERERWLVDLLNSGKTPTPEFRDARQRDSAARNFPASAPYRRMSEHPDGIVPSARLAKHTPPLGLAAEPAPETLDGVGPSQLPDDRRPDTSPLGMAPSDDQGDAGRITRPYKEGEEDDEGKRDTQPWRDDGSEAHDAPVSVRSEFNRSLSETPSAQDEPDLQPRFRHRGPFTRAQAEIAVTGAQDVGVVMEILLRYARQFFERSAILTVSGSEGQVRLTHGIARRGMALRVSLEEQSLLREAFVTGDPAVRMLDSEGVDAQVAEAFGVVPASRVAVVPLCIRERVVALFYGDDGADGVDRSAVADVTDFTEICSSVIARLIIARKS